MNYNILELGNELVVSSLQIAEVFNKKHFHVMRDIKTLKLNFDRVYSMDSEDDPNLDSLNSTNPNMDLLKFENLFYKDNYKDAKGEKRSFYYMTKDGFVLLVMGYTGLTALQFKLAYINEFNRMKAELEAPSSQPEEEKTFFEEFKELPILEDPFNDDQPPYKDRYVFAVINIMLAHGFNLNNYYTVDGLKELRDIARKLHLLKFEEIIMYCAQRKKYNLHYVLAVARNYLPSSYTDRSKSILLDIDSMKTNFN